MGSRHRLICGGQTGVDRAALEFALAHGITYGGWCPRGGWAEDMPDPPGVLARYPLLRETPSADPAQRTLWNVRDSDATLVITRTEPTGGTAATIEAARRLGHPLWIAGPCGHGAVEDVIRFLAGRAPGEGAALNVAGPRSSEDPGIHVACRAYLEEIADALLGSPPR